MHVYRKKNRNDTQVGKMGLDVKLKTWNTIQLILIDNRKKIHTESSLFPKRYAYNTIVLCMDMLYAEEESNGESSTWFSSRAEFFMGWIESKRERERMREERKLVMVFVYSYY